MSPFAVSALAALTLVAAPAPEKKPEGKGPTQPVLLVRHLDGLGHCDYLVHAVPQSVSAEQPSRLAADIHPPLVLVHTSTTSGQMTRLVASGHSAVPGPPMNIDRTHHTRTTIAGVAAHGGFLYVVLHTRNWTVMQPEGGRDGPERSKYELLVFRLSDAKKLHTLEIKEGDFPKELPYDTSAAGPLKAVCRGVTCYGVLFKFKGKEVEQLYEKKQ